MIGGMLGQVAFEGFRKRGCSPAFHLFINGIAELEERKRRGVGVEAVAGDLADPGAAEVHGLIEKASGKKLGQRLTLAGDLEVKIGFDGRDLRFTQGAAPADVLKKLGDRAVRQSQPLTAVFLYNRVEHEGRIMISDCVLKSSIKMADGCARRFAPRTDCMFGDSALWGFIHAKCEGRGN